MPSSKTIETIRQEFLARAKLGITADPELVFEQLERDRKSGKLADDLRKTNRILVGLDEKGQLIWEKGDSASE